MSPIPRTENAPLLSNADSKVARDTTIDVYPEKEADAAEPILEEHDDDNHPDDHEDHPNAVMNFFRRVNAIRGVIIIAFIVGASNGIVASISQDLKYDAFGDNRYMIAGTFGSCKSLLQYLYMPLLGAMSDIHGRYYCLIVSMASSVLPYAAFLVVGENFWAYSIANVVFGSYGASLALTMMVTLDTLPKKDQTAGFSIIMASFLVGIGGTSFMNGLFHGAIVLFGISASLQVVGVMIVILMVPNKAPGWKRALLKQKRKEASAPAVENIKGTQQNVSAGFSTESTVCPVSGAASTPGGKCPVERVHNAEADAENLAAEHHPDTTCPVSKDSSCIVKINRTSNAPASSSNGTVVIHKGMSMDDFAKIDPMTITADDVKKLSFCLKICIYARRVKYVVKLHPKILILCGVVFWNFMTTMMLEEMLLMYLMMKPRSYSMMDLNIVLAVMAGAGVFGLLFCIDLLRRWVNDMWLLRMSLVANCAMCVLYAFVKTKWQGYSLPIFSVIGMAAYPAVCTVAAYIAGDNTFGVVNGLMGATRQIAGVISPFVYGVMFQSSMHSAFPGWPFIAGGGSLMLGLLTTFFIQYTPMKKNKAATA